MWYRVELATGPGYIGKPLVVYCAKFSDERTLVVDMNRGPWVVMMPRPLFHAMTCKHEPVSDTVLLKKLEAIYDVKKGTEHGTQS
jgi:hypothetical protein